MIKSVFMLCAVNTVRVQSVESFRNVTLETEVQEDFFKALNQHLYISFLFPPQL